MSKFLLYIELLCYEGMFVIRSTDAQSASQFVDNHTRGTQYVQ